jgi:hypothetical protein
MAIEKVCMTSNNNCKQNIRITERKKAELNFNGILICHDTTAIFKERKDFLEYSV